MSDFSAVDTVLMPWAETRGLYVYCGHRQNVVRSVTLYVWQGSRHDSLGHIWLDPANDLGLIGVHAAQGSLRFDEAVPAEKLAAALDLACDRLAEHKRRTGI